ncbi:unnamed protein product [Arabidopsis thaliana]|uniref:Uncharacterized protein n=2 Tax=Arabidopsis thaliana TaxID=3702 RepID=A0A654GF67_ARATH|nr:uncharacterized protein AT5G66658 [Arabidopsis thaliana]AED98246.1 hypothetical protein AT5G66658 [Arabidopsis thaliana]CAA0412504.1 unnamed protein product [Arabidopsis thaliana]VYS71624.1 unnamed protein product [Arabidopsis thaliana]|eukprot:NP_001032164.1 hypothetical protein AT5G66658 [Arabidopsis thaliana]
MIAFFLQHRRQWKRESFDLSSQSSLSRHLRRRAMVVVNGNENSKPTVSYSEKFLFVFDQKLIVSHLFVSCTWIL